jgi:hypothetical protein
LKYKMTVFNIKHSFLVFALSKPLKCD